MQNGRVLQPDERAREKDEKMYERVDANLSFKVREARVLEFWKENDTFRKSIKQREGCPTYMFYDGPPTANGKPHIGHVLTRVIKDTVPRYHAMKGEYVPRKAGWDTHGLPVELEVEKAIGIDGKDQIEAYGVEPFIGKCKESVWKYESMWREFSDLVGFWADMDDPYVTYHDDYIESEWWALKQIFDKGLLYKGYKVVPYCPRCGTPLSSHEVAQGYKAVRERSAVVRFMVKDEENVCFLAWTTTPWTLPSNVALCVNPKDSYVRIRVEGEEMEYILAAELVDTVIGSRYPGKQITTLATYLGKDLEYKEYVPLFDFTAKAVEERHGKAHYVVCDPYVTMTDGTGIVHIAPAFGEDDARIGRTYDLPLVQLVDEKGQMRGGTPWDGIFVKKADPEILKALDIAGQLYSAPKFEHDYPHCWRCGTPLLYYARESWFIRMTQVREHLIANNKKINWIPASIGQGRFGDWLENIQDWALSRDRYWGTPLPIWECQDCHTRIAIGSKGELKEKGINCPDDIELHKPFVDAVECRCEKCGGVMRRVPEVIDCWFDSGAMPFAQHHYPFENHELFAAQFPASFISEAVDQTRGWFYSLHAISTLLFDEPCFENCMVLGLVLDENGEKMSKSKGNAVDPMDALRDYGADAIRWYFTVNSAPWLPSRFSGDAVREGQNKFLGTLWNTYAFYVLYANIDEFNPMDYTVEYDQLPVMDKWLLSRLHTLIEDVDNDLANYKLTEAGKALAVFVEEMSNWYVRLCRSRFWAGGMKQDKVNAYTTLYTALVTVAKLAAPIIPFMTEDMYRNLVARIDPTAPESVHLCDYPVSDPSMIDGDLEANMEHVLEAVTLGRAARNAGKVKNRQPLSRVLVKSDRALPEYFAKLILQELNVKELETIEDDQGFISYTFKPQLKTVGPKYGKLLGGIRKHLAELDGASAMAELNETGALTFDANGETVALTREDLLIDTAQKEGFAAQSWAGVTVVLDLALTDELIEEGNIRELVSKIQNLRKEAGFDVVDHIILYTGENETLGALVKRNEAQLKKEVLADEIRIGETGGYTKATNINGEKTTLGVARIERPDID